MGVQEGAGAPGVSQEQIDEIVGEGARDRGGKGNANAGDGGVAFVLGSSGPSPGGPDRVRGLSCHQPCNTHICTAAFLIPQHLRTSPRRGRPEAVHKDLMQGVEERTSG